MNIMRQHIKRCKKYSLWFLSSL